MSQPSNENVRVPVPGIIRKNKWTYPLLDLCGWVNNPQIFCNSLVCYPCAVAQTAAHLDSNDDPCMCFYPGGGWRNRLHAESQFAIEPVGCFKNMYHACCCAPCSNTQIQREISTRRQLALHNAMSAPQKQTM